MQSHHHLYRFIGLHTFLIGLFPFYIPVYLWKMGLSVSGISFFIALTGVGFCLTLWLWDRVHKRVSLKWLIAFSFLLEIILIAMIFRGDSNVFLPVFALLNGAYNCLFWTTQRMLFAETIQPDNSGKKFGNLQIVVALLLKTGIFIGGLMLDAYGFTSVFLFSSLVAGLAAISFLTAKGRTSLPTELLETEPLGLSKILLFKDHFRSTPVFLLDGFFLFLESYFWMISMFLIVKESFWELGVLVIVLMVVFTLLFLVIKNSIDRLPATSFYRLAVILYASSWLLRGIISDDLNKVTLFLLLVLITFFTSLFRLTFNKRFFDLAKSSSTYQYLIHKSYHSQAGIALFFGILGALLSNLETDTAALSKIYLVAGVIAGGYIIYGKTIKRPVVMKPVSASTLPDSLSQQSLNPKVGNQP